MPVLCNVCQEGVTELYYVPCNICKGSVHIRCADNTRRYRCDTPVTLNLPYQCPRCEDKATLSISKIMPNPADKKSDKQSSSNAQDANPEVLMKVITGVTGEDGEILLKFLEVVIKRKIEEINKDDSEEPAKKSNKQSKATQKD